MRPILQEFSRFLVVGAINILVTYLVYVLLLLFLPYPVSYTLGYVSGIFISYYLNSRFVFRLDLRLVKAIQYPIVYVVQYLAGLLFLYGFVERLHIDPLVAPVLVIVCTTPITFLMSRLIIKGVRSRGDDR